MIYAHTSTAQLSPDRSTVVLVHGLTCTHRDWMPQIKALADEHQVVAVDLRSHGNSGSIGKPRDMDTMAADVIELLRHYGLPSAVFAGHSMGTRVVASLAQQAPELVRGIVFVDGSRQGVDNPDTLLRNLNMQLINEAAIRSFIKHLFDQMFSEKSNSLEREQIVQRAVNTPTATFQDLITQMLIWDSTNMESAFRSIRSPLHVVQSTTVNAQRERRSLATQETVPYLEFIASTVPHASTEIVPDIGHFIQLDAPEIVTRALRDMLEATRA